MNSSIVVRLGKYVFTPREDITAYEVSKVVSMFLKAMITPFTEEELGVVLQETGLHVHFAEMSDTVAGDAEDETES